jgi:flagellar hook protein FlgE
MFDSVFIGMSGLQSFSRGLKVISNNVANMNTAGFKATNLSFSDMVYQQGGVSFGSAAGTGARFGSGVATLGTHIDFAPGESRQTGNPLDMSIAGDGFFVTQDSKTGDRVYTRVGQFDFDDEGFLIQRGTDRRVLGYSSEGSLSPVTISALRSNAPQATARVEFVGNLSSTATTFSIPSLRLRDATGGEHTVRLDFAPKSGQPGVWTVKSVDGTVEAALGEIKFTDGKPDSGNTLTLRVAKAGVAPFDVSLDLSKNITSFAAGTSSTLSVDSVDGSVAGTLSAVSFDTSGVMTVRYTNGQDAKGAQLALARFASTDGLEQVAGGGFVARDDKAAQIGRPGGSGFGELASNQVESSNVDLSAEFSELIIMQRGYQASSQIVSTANDMLRQLFDMKGRG